MDEYTLILSLFVSSLGMGYFVYGKKTQSFTFMVAGGLMTFYGYFVDSFLLSVVIGVVLMVAPFVLRFE